RAAPAAVWPGRHRRTAPVAPSTGAGIDPGPFHHPDLQQFCGTDGRQHDPACGQTGDRDAIVAEHELDLPRICVCPISVETTSRPDPTVLCQVMKWPWGDAMINLTDLDARYAEFQSRAARVNREGWQQVVMPARTRFTP